MFNFLATKRQLLLVVTNMHTLGFLGPFDRTLGPAKYNYDQTLANLSGNVQPLLGALVKFKCTYFSSMVLPVRPILCHHGNIL